MNTEEKVHNHSRGSIVKSNLKELWRTFTSNKLLVAIVLVIGAMVVFKAGFATGFHKATFAGRSNHFYFRSIEGGEPQMFDYLIKDQRLPIMHGATGKIVSVSLPEFVVAGPDNAEKTIIINDGTVIRRFKDSVSSSTITADEYTVVLGNPDESGRIQAKFIRILPPPPSQNF